MWWQRAWYRSGVHPLLWLLWPLQQLYIGITQNKRRKFIQNPPKAQRVPVIVVGNITVGGAGKTPTVIALIEWLQQQGYRPGVIARGYGGRGPFPQQVTSQSDSAMIGDEPRLIVLRTGITMVVDPNRRRAAEQLLAIDPTISIIISDDGLQHYRLSRDLEVVVVDGERLLGNGQCLPLGPLRELPTRLNQVDLLVQNGGTDKTFRYGEHRAHRFSLMPLPWRRVIDNQIVTELPAGERIAIAGIANPQRFFKTLAQQQCSVNHCVEFPDHHPFSHTDFEQWNDVDALLMTEKDAVKCQSFAQPNWYYLPVTAEFPPAFWSQFKQQLEQVLSEREHLGVQ